MLPCLGSWRNPTLSGVCCQWSRIRLEKKVTLGEVELQSEATNILLFMGPFTSSKHSLSCDVAGLGERHLNRSICLWEGRMAEYVMQWEQRFGGQSDQILRMCVCLYWQHARVMHSCTDYKYMRRQNWGNQVRSTCLLLLHLYLYHRLRYWYKLYRIIQAYSCTPGTCMM